MERDGRLRPRNICMDRDCLGDVSSSFLGSDLDGNFASGARLHNPVKLTGDSAASRRLDAEYFEWSRSRVGKPILVLDERPCLDSPKIIGRCIELDVRNFARLKDNCGFGDFNLALLDLPIQRPRRNVFHVFSSTRRILRIAGS